MDEWMDGWIEMYLEFVNRVQNGHTKIMLLYKIENTEQSKCHMQQVGLHIQKGQQARLNRKCTHIFKILDRKDNI